MNNHCPCGTQTNIHDTKESIKLGSKLDLCADCRKDFVVDIENLDRNDKHYKKSKPLKERKGVTWEFWI